MANAGMTEFFSSNKSDDLAINRPTYRPANGGSKEANPAMPPSWFQEWACPLPRLQKELLNIGGSWRSVGFFACCACDYIM